MHFADVQDSRGTPSIHRPHLHGKYPSLIYSFIIPAPKFKDLRCRAAMHASGNASLASMEALLRRFRIPVAVFKSLLQMSFGGRVHQCLAHGLALEAHTRSACLMSELFRAVGFSRDPCSVCGLGVGTPGTWPCGELWAALLPTLALRIRRGCFTCAAGCSHRWRQCSAFGNPLLCLMQLAPGHPRACPLEAPRLIACAHRVRLCKQLSPYLGVHRSGCRSLRVAE